MYTAQQAGSFVPCPCLKVEIDDPSALTFEEWRIGPPCKWAFRPIEHLALKRIEAQKMPKASPIRDGSLLFPAIPSRYCR